MVVVFDKPGALERVGGDLALLRDLIKLCHEQCDARMMVLTHEVRHKDLPAVRRQAHLLKGALGNVGAVAAFQAAEALERAALDERVEDIEPLAEHFLDRIQEFFRSVESELP